MKPNSLLRKELKEKGLYFDPHRDTGAVLRERLSGKCGDCGKDLPRIEDGSGYDPYAHMKVCPAKFS